MGHMTHPSEPPARTVKAGNPWAVTDRGDTTIKKKAFAIVTLCISLFAAVALVGCGGSGGATGSGGGGGAEKPAVDMRTDFIWFKVEVPEGVEIIDVDGDTADKAQFKFTESEHASDRLIPVFDSDKDAVETMMKSLEFADDIAKAKTEAMNVKLDDIEIKR